MTVARFASLKGRLYFSARGHSKDPRVCAAVSALAGTLAAWAVNFGKNPEHMEESGRVKVSFDETEDASSVFRFTELGFLELQHNYGDNVRVISGNTAFI